MTSAHEDHEYELVYTVRVQCYGKRTQVIKETNERLTTTLRNAFLGDADHNFVRAKVLDRDQ